CGSIAAFRYQLSGLPNSVDASHETGIRDLVHPATLPRIMAGASVVLVEAHPNPLIAKSDASRGSSRSSSARSVRAAREAWRLRRELDRSYLASAAVEKEYLARMEADKERLLRSGHGNAPLPDLSRPIARARRSNQPTLRWPVQPPSLRGAIRGNGARRG